MVITGDTGSGKSTQLPQYIYDSDQIKRKLLGELTTVDKISIVVTQPRRVATISMAKRICFERGTTLEAGEIAYAIRFDDRTKPNTLMRYVTDGILVRECVSVSFSQTGRIRFS